MGQACMPHALEAPGCQRCVSAGCRRWCVRVARSASMAPSNSFTAALALPAAVASDNIPAALALPPAGGHQGRGSRGG